MPWPIASGRGDGRTNIVYSLLGGKANWPQEYVYPRSPRGETPGSYEL